jgi:methionyl-tRNA formyltransferase
MRVAFLGTSDFAVAVLEALLGSEHELALVVTRPDRPRGRGRRSAPPPAAAAALAAGIEVAQPEDVNGDEARARIAAAAPDVVCVCAFGALLKEPLLSEHAMLNVHPSLLPRWRGAAPIERAIMAGDAETGVSIMRVTAGLDSGPVCLAEPEPIAARDSYGTLAPRLAALGGRLLLRALAESPEFREQDEAGATYAEKIGPQDRRLDPGEPAPALERRVRALAPHIGAYAELEDGERLGILDAVAREQELDAGAISAADGRLLLGCAGGVLEALAVKPPGGREMEPAAYLRGYRPPARWGG